MEAAARFIDAVTQIVVTGANSDARADRSIVIVVVVMWQRRLVRVGRDALSIEFAVSHVAFVAISTHRLGCNQHAGPEDLHNDASARL